MAFKDDLKGTRDYLVTKTVATWGVSSHEPPKVKVSEPFTLIELEEITFEPESISSSDTAFATFSIAGQFEVGGPVDNDRMEKISDLRAAILTDPHAGNFATSLQVTAATVGGGAIGEKFYQVFMTVVAEISADR